MASTRHALRSSATPQTSKTTAAVTLSPITFTPPSPTTISLLRPGIPLPFLSKSELTLLRKKQAQLSSTAASTLEALPQAQHLNALLSTLVFAQHEAGTAVCIHPAGWLLTCAHCFGDSEEEYQDDSKRRWLLYYTGLAVLVECVVWDGRRDLALLRITAVETLIPTSNPTPTFSYLKVAANPPKSRLQILCIGQPGRDDLESAGNKKTKYNLVHISEGRYKGMTKGDPQDNSEIGTLKHDAWTYWGHSGAPLVSVEKGELVGLHSSWDDQTAMRHGVPGLAVKEFFNEHLRED